MEASEVMETLAMKADITKFRAVEEELSSLSMIEDIGSTLFVRSESKVSAKTTAILLGLLFGKRVDCSSSFITWVNKAQIAASAVQLSVGITRGLLLRASQATRIRYYAPDTSIGSSAAPPLILRFHYELRRRFDYRRSSSEYENDATGVCETVTHALCSGHMGNGELVEPLLAVLYIRRGDCAMQGRTELGKRSLPCVLCLYGTSIPGRVTHPMIYSNKLMEGGLTIEDDLKTIDGREIQPDYCDKWAHELLGFLFSGNWNAMESAIYTSTVPVIAGQRLRNILQTMIDGQTEAAVSEGITPWVVFELCKSYNLNPSPFIQKMYACSIQLAASEDESVKKHVERILGGIAAIYDYKKLMTADDPTSIIIGSENGGIAGCLYLYNDMEESTFTDRYIFHRWLMEKAYRRINSHDDLHAIQYWCSVYAIGMKRSGDSKERLTFYKGPWRLTGTLEGPWRSWRRTGTVEGKSTGFYHYRKDNMPPKDGAPAEDMTFLVKPDEKITFICDPKLSGIGT